jgi:hypothetical protein
MDDTHAAQLIQVLQSILAELARIRNALSAIAAKPSR